VYPEELLWVERLAEERGEDKLEEDDRLKDDCPLLEELYLDEGAYSRDEDCWAVESFFDLVVFALELLLCVAELPLVDLEFREEFWLL
jgi:hypothetical protein